MTNTIPMLSIAAMALSALIGLAIPVALYIILRKKGAKHLPFWTGAVTFVLFALVLEQLVYFLISKTSFMLTVSNNVWLYGIFGGFMAGLFEETGRFVAFKTVLRKKRGNDTNALMYGAGHGGIEAVLLLSANMVKAIIYALKFNAGISSTLGTLDTAQQLINTPAIHMLAGGVERILAVTIHISLSVLVWFAAKGGKKFWLYPLAILLHLVVDAVAMILKGFGTNAWLIEGAVFVVTLGLVFLAIVIWKKNHKPEAAQQSGESQQAVTTPYQVINM